MSGSQLFRQPAGGGPGDGTDTEFMKLLMPAYYMAVAFSGGSMSALALYECMLGAVTGVQWLCSTVLISMVRIYVLMVLGSHVARRCFYQS